MFRVHDGAYSIVLYTVSVGFGIAYSVTKGNARAQTRGISKLDSRASFFVFSLLGGAPHKSKSSGIFGNRARNR